MITVAMATREAQNDDSAVHQPNAGRAAPVYLGLGTNIGDREANLREALEQITGLGLTVTRRSSIYETEPVGFADQDWFLNQVIAAEMPRPLTVDPNAADAARHMVGVDAEAGTALAGQLVLLLAALLRIESAMGRRRVIANGPRVIDIDMLLCGEVAGRVGETREREANHEQIRTRRTDDQRLPELILPHPRMHLRRFVLAPLCEIAPAVIHPTTQKTCRELLAALDDPALVRLYRRHAGQVPGLE